jgi:hypothetical protein
MATSFQAAAARQQSSIIARDIGPAITRNFWRQPQTRAPIVG